MTDSVLGPHGRCVQQSVAAGANQELDTENAQRNQRRKGPTAISRLVTISTIHTNTRNGASGVFVPSRVDSAVGIATDTTSFPSSGQKLTSATWVLAALKHGPTGLFAASLRTGTTSSEHRATAVAVLRRVLRR